jgi:uncharacterized protein YcbX
MLTVARLSTTPVRGFALHHPDSIELGPHGVVGDRRYTLLADDGRIFDGTKLGELVQLRADVTSTDGSDLLRIRFPSGDEITDAVDLGPPRTVEIYGRRFTARPVGGPWNEALSAYAGRRVELVRSERLEHERDRNPVSIVSRASVAELARQGNEGRPLDSRRFRMLVELAGADRPHQEDEWLGREVRIGEAVVRVTKPDPRCVITTQDPDTGKRDFPTLHVIKAYRGLRDGHALDFGIYADVVTPGRVAVGDEVSS